ncbi:MAG TPA: sigma 54-interacting transcriptional regulator [Candidatus Binatia bacterium]|nr:sigma 54-interacting transcriptional regulator [Candidatus Binatia bacterium]
MSAADLSHDVPTSNEAAWLRQIAEGTATRHEDEFFRALVAHLADVMDTEYALIAEMRGDSRARAVAFRHPHGFESATEWNLAGSPCEQLVSHGSCHFSSGVSQRFPHHALVVDRGIESYAGIALTAPDGQLLGYLSVFGTKSMPPEPRKSDVLRIFAARAAGELARVRIQRELGESEERLRDLFDEAPIAYVHEDLESRFLRANRAALRILGVKPEEAVGTIGMSLVPQTPEAQRRVREAFESVGRGTDTSGVVLELRRKDNGKPIWIQWWSKPDPSGTYTRTMFTDITDRVLLQQEQTQLKEQNRYLREEIKSVHNFEEIVGNSQGLLSVLANVDLVCATDTTVLITGETGTGKELIARAIHSASPRRDKPLIKLNCAALPTGLVESELFGHEKGAFSGALERRLGRFELADGGTIFLDEIGEVPLDVQVKLLRVLQEREFERVGGGTPIKVDVRIIAATNRDLPRTIALGKFRQDLFYRLNVFPVHLPPLRERTEDIPLLVHYFVSRSVQRVGRPIRFVADDVIERLRRYAWPGNIRELENVVERAVILSPGDELEIGPELLPSAPPDPVAGESADARAEPAVHHSPEATGSRALEDIERAHIIEILRQANWRIEGEHGAARLLGLNPSTLRSRMKKLAIRRRSETS